MAINQRLILVLAFFATIFWKGSTEPTYFTCKEKPLDKLGNHPTDCSELPTGSVSGVYTVETNKSHPYKVFCDMDTDGGGWTVFQRRQDGTVDFYLNWTDYEDGFGSVSGEHWLGNSKIAELTEQKNYSLRVDMKDFENSSNYALYDTFRVIADEEYKLEIGGYRKEAGDAMWMCHEQRFSTQDRDNDVLLSHCAVQNEGAWWYNYCHEANLNGRYITGGHYKGKSDGSFHGIVWSPWKGYGYSLAFTEMKLRPEDYAEKKR